MFPNKPEHSGTPEQELFPNLFPPPYRGDGVGNKLVLVARNGTEQPDMMEVSKHLNALALKTIIAKIKWI